MKALLSLGLSVTLIFGGITAAVNPTTVQAESGFSYSEEQEEAVKYLNEIRKKVGVGEVELDPFLNKAALNHSKYISLNQVGYIGIGHDEEEGKKGFTGVDPYARAKAVGYQFDWVNTGISEVINYNTSDIKESIDTFLDTAYHREIILSDNATKIGIGVSEENITINFGTSNSDFATPAVYPYDGQKDVGIGFSGFEDPNPLEQFNVDKSGYIISFFEYQVSSARIMRSDLRR